MFSLLASAPQSAIKLMDSAKGPVPGRSHCWSPVHRLEVLATIMQTSNVIMILFALFATVLAAPYAPGRQLTQRGALAAPLPFQDFAQQSQRRNGSNQSRDAIPAPRTAPAGMRVAARRRNGGL
ncbi:hypothetical protein BKA62DRAFT_766148 [Auriculariales sp. MPI-PUGE-AT-0066]|nr:hypothetical protein BKA62DRAFT_766148 [Auriculariales sp. MPI-PUGE-AT-0066]